MKDNQHWLYVLHGRQVSVSYFKDTTYYTKFNRAEHFILHAVISNDGDQYHFSFSVSRMCTCVCVCNHPLSHFSRSIFCQKSQSLLFLLSTNWVRERKGGENQCHITYMIHNEYIVVSWCSFKSVIFISVLSLFASFCE